MTPSRKPSRGLLVLALALVVLAAAAVAGVALVNARPVDPAKVDRETLLQWIVTRDLAQEPTATRLALVRRLEEECRRGIDWDSLGGQLTDSQRQQLWDNIPLLLGSWIVDKAESYARSPAEEQPALLDGVIDTMAAWRGVESLPRPSEAEGKSQRPASILAMALGEIERLKSSAAPGTREQLDRFLPALQMRWLTRSLQNAK